MKNFFDLIGRVFISSVFLLSGYNKIFNYEGTVSWMESFGVPGFFLWPAIILEIILPILVIIGYQVRIASIALALFCIFTGLIFHLDFDNQMQVIALLKNLGLAGGFFFLAINGPRDWVIQSKKKYVRL